MAIDRKNQIGKEPPKPERGRGSGGALDAKKTIREQLEAEAKGAIPQGGLAPFESDEVWSSEQLPMGEVLEMGGGEIMTDLSPIGEEPDLQGRLVQMMSGSGGLPMETSVRLAKTIEQEIDEGKLVDLEAVHNRIREFAEMILGTEKPKTYWERLENMTRENPKEAAREIQKQWERVEVVVPQFVLNNLERLGNGETKLWREQGTVAVFDLAGFTRKAEQMVQDEDAQKTGSGSHKLNQIISQCFGRIHEEAGIAGGELVSLGGDEVVYIFTTQDHEARALHFASRVKEQFKNGSEITLKGGVATGDLLLGAIKLDDKRSLPVVLGEPMMGARMMERGARKGDVMVHSGLEGRLMAMQAKYVYNKDKVGLQLGSCTALEQVGQFARNGRAERRSSVDLASLQQAAKFLHPHLRYVGEHQGISENLYTGETPSAAVSFVDMDLDDLHHAIVREVGREAGVADAPALAELAGVLKLLNDKVRQCHGTMEKFILSPGHSKAPALFTRGDRLAAHGLQWATEEVRALSRRGINASASVKVGIVYRGVTGPKDSGFPQGELGFIGDVANVTARLASQAEWGAVLTDTLTTAEAEAGAVKVYAGQPRNQRALELKGVTAKGTIVQVEKIESVESTLEHLASGKAVGREAQKKLMQSAFQRMMRTGEQVVETIIAEAGEGKSLLTDEMVREHYFDKRDAEVLKGKAGETSADDAYSMWRMPARKLFGIESDDDARTVLDKITGKLFEINPEYVKYAELFAEQFGLADINVSDDQHFAGFNAKAAEVFGRLMGSQSEDTPIIVVMEDLHWADRASKALLKSVMQDTKHSRVLFHLVARPEEQMDFYRLDEDTVYQIELGPLARECWADFIATQFAIAGMPEYADWEKAGRPDLGPVEFRMMRRNARLVEETYRISGGNPYVARRLINYLLYYHEFNQNKINPKTDKTLQFFEETEKGEYIWADYIDYGKLGEVAKLMDIVSARMLDSMQSLNERACFKLAATFGREFTAQEIEAVTGLNPRDIADYFARWRRLGYVEAGAESFSFAHANLHKVVETGIAEIALEDAGGNVKVFSNAEIYRLVGEYVEKHGGRLEDLARLFGMGDDIPKGMEYNRQLGDVAFGRQDAVSYQLAVTAYNRTIELFNNNFVPALRGEDLDIEQRRENERRMSNWRHLPKHEKKQAVGDLLQAHCRLAKTHARVGLGNENREQALQAIGSGQRQLEQYRNMLGHDEATHLDAQLATAKADLLVRMTKYDEAETELSKIAELMKAMEGEKLTPEHTILLANYYDAEGLVYSRTKRLDEAMAVYEKALALVSEDSDDLEVFEVWDRVTGHKVSLLDALGRHEEAQQLAQGALAQEEEHGYWTGAVLSRIKIVDRMSRGDVTQVEKARKIAYATLPLVRDHAPAFEMNIYRVVVNIEETLKNYAQAAELIYEFVPMIGGHWGIVDEDRRINLWKIDGALLLARVGRLDDARDILEQIPQGGEYVSTRSQAMVLQTEAIIASDEHDFASADDKFEMSLGLAQELDGDLDIAAILVDRAQHKREALLDDVGASEDLLRAIAIFDNNGERAEADFATKMLEDILSAPASRK